MVDLLLAGGLTADEQREYLETAKASGDAMLRMLNEILDLSKIEAGRLELDTEPYAIRSVVTDAIAALRAVAERKGLAVACRVTEDVPEWLLGDAHRVRQIIVNLVANAVKFTERGGVTVTIARSGQDLVGTVADTGIGIPADKQPIVFEAFRQADASATRRHAGTGLGLAITKELLRLMGGSITLTSEVGNGSTFTFRVPLRVPTDAVPERQRPTPALSLPTRTLHILVADDNVVNQKILQAMITADKHTVVVVGDGEAATAAVMEHSFDLVLMDIQMPGVDGFEATRRIRDHERATGRHLRIVALTAHAMAGDRERCLAAGMDDYLTKPVSRDELRQALGRADVRREKSI